MRTPNSNRKHIAIFGETNSGKSSLFNAILGANSAIVSEISGTTTDPVQRAMELIPYGPVVLIDTAGLNDSTELGLARMKKTREIVNRTDLAVYTADPENFDGHEFETMKAEFERRNVPFLLVITKTDVSNPDTVKDLSEKFGAVAAISVNDTESMESLKKMLAEALEKLTEKEEQIIGGLVPSSGLVVMVVPIDSAAPKGRLILPQVQTIRDCLDSGIRCLVTTPENLSRALSESERVDLVVTDSQVFVEVDKIVPGSIPLTSFSILMARQKGDIAKLISGIQAVRELKDGDIVVITEACTHTRTHEDIGQVKIPKLLRKITGKQLDIRFMSGRDMTEFDGSSMIIHCGGCMITRKEMLNRIIAAAEKGIPITNYGIFLAFAGGILERSTEILNLQEEN